MVEEAGTKLSYGREEFFSPRTLTDADETLSAVFTEMLGFEIVTAVCCSSFSTPNDDVRTAIVGLSGIVRGTCTVRMTTRAAQAMASAMLGDEEADEEMLNDALGELCNMIAGGWKNRIPLLASECRLSPPTVISGSAYKVHVSQATEHQKRCYDFAGNQLHLSLSCEFLTQIATA